MRHVGPLTTPPMAPLLCSELNFQSTRIRCPGPTLAACVNALNGTARLAGLHRADCPGWSGPPLAEFGVVWDSPSLKTRLAGWIPSPGGDARGGQAQRGPVPRLAGRRPAVGRPCDVDAGARPGQRCPDPAGRAQPPSGGTRPGAIRLTLSTTRTLSVSPSSTPMSAQARSCATMANVLVGPWPRPYRQHQRRCGAQLRQSPTGAMLIACGSARDSARAGRTFPSDRLAGIEWARVAARVGKARPCSAQ